MVTDIVCWPQVGEAHLLCGWLFHLVGEEPVQAPHPALVCISRLCSVVSWAAMSFRNKAGHTLPREIDS